MKMKYVAIPGCWREISDERPGSEGRRDVDRSSILIFRDDRRPIIDDVSFHALRLGRLGPTRVDAGLIDDGQLEIVGRSGDRIAGQADVSEVRGGAGAESHAANPNRVVETWVQVGQVCCEEKGYDTVYE